MDAAQDIVGYRQLIQVPPRTVRPFVEKAKYISYHTPASEFRDTWIQKAYFMLMLVCLDSLTAIADIHDALSD